VIVRASALHYLVMIPVQLEYTAPTGCPTQAEFVAFVTNRGGDFAHPAAKIKARTMIVTLRRDASEVTGSLELRQDDMASDARQLRAQSCVEVAEALAVVAAIALRGSDEAPVEGDVSPAQPPPSPAPAPSAPVAAIPAAAATPAVVPNETRLRPIGMWGNEQVPVTAGSLGVKRILTATLTGGAVLGAIPGVVLPRFDLTLSRTNFITTPQQASFLTGGVVTVGWSYFGNVTRHSGDYATDINGLKAGIGGCTPLTYDTAGLVAMVCSMFTAGLLHLDTKEATSGYHQDKLLGLGAASIALDARYNIGKHLHVSALAGGEMWFGQLSAERVDGSKLFQARLFNANLQLGLGVHF
jgi:hypothetical protein